MREKAAAHPRQFDQTQENITFLEAQAAETYEQFRADGRTLRITAEQQGFGALTSRRPWQRARWGLVAGVIIGAPWVVLGLAGVSWPRGPESYPELAAVAAVAPLAARRAGYGLLFGYFFPLLRGSTGLGKAVWFSVAASAPAVCAAMADAQTTARKWDSTALLVTQLFAFAMTLGIMADRAVLLENGSRTGRLVDLHNLWTVSAWASSVAVAVAAGIAAAIVAGLQPFVIGVIAPSSPAPQPTATPTQTPSTPPATPSAGASPSALPIPQP